MECGICFKHSQIIESNRCSCLSKYQVMSKTMLKHVSKNRSVSEIALQHYLLSNREVTQKDFKFNAKLSYIQRPTIAHKKL